MAWIDIQTDSYIGQFGVQQLGAEFGILNRVSEQEKPLVYILDSLVFTELFALVYISDILF